MLRPGERKGEKVEGMEQTEKRIVEEG